MSKRLMAYRTKLVAVIYAGSYPFACFITKFFISSINQQFVWILITGSIQILACTYAMLTIGNPEYWKTCQFDDSTYLPSKNFKAK